MLHNRLPCPPYEILCEVLCIVLSSLVVTNVDAKYFTELAHSYFDKFIAPCKRDTPLTYATIEIGGNIWTDEISELLLSSQIPNCIKDRVGILRSGERQACNKSSSGYVLLGNLLLSRKLIKVFLITFKRSFFLGCERIHPHRGSTLIYMLLILNRINSEYLSVVINIK